MRPVKDWAGARVGHSLVLGRAARVTATDTHAAWRVKCGCGAEFVRPSDAIAASAKRGTSVLCDRCVVAYRSIVGSTVSRRQRPISSARGRAASLRLAGKVPS